MEIVITAQGDTLDAPLECRFAKAARLIFYDLERDRYQDIDNRHNAEASREEALRTAERLICLRVGAVVTGCGGCEALQLLARAGIGVYTSQARTVSEAIEQFRAGQLVPANSVNRCALATVNAEN